jgi:ADP-ribose pyrophosphatase YjhB (NUDIX family)
MDSKLNAPAPASWNIHPTPQRHSMAQHLTASGVVFHEDHVLLIHHKRIGAWLPPGGHVEDMELPHEAVVREVFEETGVVVEVLSPVLPDTGDPDAFLLPGALCMHAVRAVEKGVSSYHLDIAYLCRPVLKKASAAFVQEKGRGDKFDTSDKIDKAPVAGSGMPELTDNEEVHGAAWIPFDKLNEYVLAKNVMEVLALARAAVEDCDYCDH